MSNKLWTEEQFNCPVCLDLPNDPVTIPCGHSYCMECIKDYWGNDEHIGIYSCPQCRQSFCPRPTLCRNTMLAEAVEQLKRGGLRSRTSISSPQLPSSSPAAPAPAVPTPAASTPVALCDVCEGDPRPAAKTCLVCLASYCVAHLKPHQQAPALKHHELIGPTVQLMQKICVQHKYLQEFYCRKCCVYVCWLCTSNQHKEHDTTSTKAERTQRQAELEALQSENKQKLQEREGELKEMKKVLESLKRSADQVQEDSRLALAELQCSVERMQTLVGEVMESCGRAKLTDAQEVVNKLEAEIVELKKRDLQMKDLVTCEDNIHFLQHCEAFSVPIEAGELPKVIPHPDVSFEPVYTAVLELRDKVEDMCNQELSQITKTVDNTVLFTLGDNNTKSSGQRFKIEFLKLFSGLGSKGADKRGQGSTGSSSGVRSTERRMPVSSLRTQNVRSRDDPQVTRNSPNLRETNRREAGRDTPPSQQREPELFRRADTSVALPAGSSGAGRAAVLQGAGVVALLSTDAVSGAGVGTRGPAGNTAQTAVFTEQVNPSLFLDTPDGLVNPVFPELREIPIQNLQSPEPKTRSEFLQYACNPVLDPDTAHRRLYLSEANTKATLQGSTQPCQDLPQRFDSWTQVMCKDPLVGERCYWEVEWRGRGSSVGVAYTALARKGADARAGLGYNMLSWSLELSDTCCSAMHNNEKQDIAVNYSPRVGVYLDQKEGKLAFYSVADNMLLLHVFHASFVQPLFPAFGVGSGVGIGLDFALGQFSSMSDTVKICSL